MFSDFLLSALWQSSITHMNQLAPLYLGVRNLFRRAFSLAMIVLLSLSVIVLTLNLQPVSASAVTIYIGNDGSIIPSGAPIVTSDGVKYNFTSDISYPTYAGVVVLRNNIILDGKGYTIQGNQAGDGLDCQNVYNVTIKNVNIENFTTGVFPYDSSRINISGNNITANTQYGMYLDYSSNDNISGNNITNDNIGIYIVSSNFDNVSGNNVANNWPDGIYLYSSSNNNLTGNNIANSNVGFYLYSSSYNSMSGNNITNNNYGAYVYYYSINDSISANSVVASGYAGIYVDAFSSNSSISGNNITGISGSYHGLYLSSSSNSSIRGNNVANNDNGIELYYSCNDSNVSGNNVTNNNYGICLYSSFTNSSISGNNITASSIYGVDVEGSLNSSISGNTFTNDGLYVLNSYQSSVTSNTVNGKPLVYLEGTSNYTVGNAGQVVLVSCNNVTVANLNLSNASVGVELWATNNGTVSGNILANNHLGIYLYSSYNNVISGNNVTNNTFGLGFDPSSDNEIYHNNIINNSGQAGTDESGSRDVWDNGYPSGGNYWSDYAGDDLNSGPYQNVTDSDGIGDTPYVIDDSNVDNYPLMQPWTGPLPTSTTITLSVSLVSVGSNVTCTATVSGVNVGTRGTGTVTWSTSSSTGSFGTPVCILSSGSCSTTYSDSRPGSETIAACYSGDSDYQPSSGSTTLTVVSSGPVYYSKNYASVQAAINNVPTGSNLIVGPGKYGERLVLSKPLTIIGDPSQDGQAVFSGGGSGIYLTVYSGASGTIVTGFEITSYAEGILVYASNCQIYSNTMSSIVEDGIALDGSSATGDVVYDNVFQNTPTAVNLTDSAGGNTIYGNIISSQATVTLNVGTSGNTVYQNVIWANSIVLNITGSQGNTFYHNDFLATVQITSTGINSWNDTYPSGGNYWSDYNGQDMFSGPFQNLTGGDGIGDTPKVINGNNRDNYPLMKPYALATGQDLAVTNVAMAKTVIMQGYTGNVTVTAFNKGQYTETFSVTAYANTTVIGTQQVSNLGIAGQITLTFTWNTASCPKGNYTISAYAEPVQGETDIANNNFTGGMIHASMVGDLTGATPFVPDGKCDGRDITVVAKCFGTGLGDPRYNPNCDILNRGKIDGRDITIVAKHFGEHSP